MKKKSLKTKNIYWTSKNKSSQLLNRTFYWYIGKSMESYDFVSVFLSNLLLLLVEHV